MCPTSESVTFAEDHTKLQSTLNASTQEHGKALKQADIQLTI